MKRELPTIERLREAIRLDPETGKIYWRITRGRARTGAEAFTTVTPGGYAYGGLDGRMFTRGRVVFALTHGRWPVGEVRHLDEDPGNDRPGNLADPQTDPRGAARSWTPNGAERVSQHLGVSREDSTGRWKARRAIGGHNISLGQFDSEESAARAYDAAAHLTGSDFANRAELRNFLDKAAA